MWTVVGKSFRTCDGLSRRTMLQVGALAGAGFFTAEKINMHARTNMAVISEFLGVRFETREEHGFTSVNLVE